MDVLRAVDPKVYEAVRAEERRQSEGLELIASENYTSPAVLACQGSVLTNKYAEGYPGRRYYGGCEHVDVVEQLAIDRAKSLFGAEAANVQPHSGASANTAVFFAALEPKATILSMDLAHGGHLTHGMSLNYSGKYFNIVHYGVDKATERIDYNLVRELAVRFKPKLLLAGASAYPRIIDFAVLGGIAKEVGALFLVDMAHISGLVATGHHPNPVPYADFVTSTTHKTLRGPRSGFILCKQEWLKAINSAVFPGLQGGPLMHVVAAKAVTFGEAATPAFKAYSQQVLDNAQVLARTLMDAGLRLVSGGTDNHLMMVDVTSIPGMTGKIAEATLDQAGITANKNMIPFDTRKPLDPSGIRLGTPALTTRGMGEGEMERVGALIVQVLRHADDPARVARIREEVRELCAQFPVPGIDN